MRDDNTLVGVNPLQLFEYDIVGDKADLAGDHHGGKHHQEQEVTILELDPGKGVGGQGCDTDFQDNPSGGCDGTVDIEPAKGGKTPSSGEVIPTDDARPPDGWEGSNFSRALQGGGYHPEEWDPYDGGGKEKYQMSSKSAEVPGERVFFQCIPPNNGPIVLRACSV